MRKKINFSMLILIFITTMLLTIFQLITFFSVLEKQTILELENKINLVIPNIEFVNKNNLDYKNVLKDFKITDRITLINSNGDVLFDNKVNYALMENHSNRSEIIEAIKNGFGKSSRVSDTIGTTNYYYAKKISDNNILRISTNIQNIYGLLYNLIPQLIIFIILIFIISYYISKKLSNNILIPINNISLDSIDKNIVYPEIIPFIKKIEAQKKEIEEKLFEIKEKSETISLIINKINEGFILLDSNKNIITINDCAKKIFDAKKDLIGKELYNLCLNPEINEGIKNVISNKNHKIQINLNELYYDVYFSYVKEIGIMILFLDVTEKIFAENKRKEFSANVSHELKTPLTTILGYTEIILNGMVKKDDIMTFINKIKDDSLRLLGLIEDIILISNLDEGYKDKKFTQVDILDTINDVVSNLILKLDKNNISILINQSKNSYIILASEKLIYELFLNLIDNAIKYNNFGGKIVIDINEEIDGEEKFVKIKIIDTGIGISANEQNKIFERFYRIDKSRSKKTGGSGLGLSIVKHIVLYHKGKIDLFSQEEIGTEIIVYLPV